MDGGFLKTPPFLHGENTFGDVKDPVAEFRARGERSGVLERSNGAFG